VSANDVRTPAHALRHADQAKEAAPSDAPFEGQALRGAMPLVDIEVPREDVPFPILLPHFSMPELLTGVRGAEDARGPKAGKFWIRGASASAGVDDQAQRLIARLGVHSVIPEGEGRVAEFCLMLAKITHSFATAELGVGSFEPLLLPVLRNGDLSECAQFVGSDDPARPPVPTPTYHVVVGSSDRFDPVTKGRVFRDSDL
jgi:hypothetical protein